MEGKKAVVVGAGQPHHHLLGNGRAIAELFAREGAEVCAVDMHKDRAEETVASIEAAGGTAHAVVADIGGPQDCAGLIADSHAAMGRIDVLVNNVGVNHGDRGPLDLDVAGWQEIFDINLRAMWLTSKAVVPLMKDQGGGAITNISTVGSRAAGGPLFAYSISKAGVNALTRFFAVEFAPFNIRCNAILPGFIATPHSMEGLVQAGVAISEDRSCNACTTGCRWAGWAPPWTSPTPRCSCPPTSPISPPALRFRSTAAPCPSSVATNGARHRNRESRSHERTAF